MLNEPTQNEWKCASWAPAEKCLEMGWLLCFINECDKHMQNESLWVFVCRQLFDMRSKLYSENVIQKMRSFNLFNVLNGACKIPHTQTPCHLIWLYAYVKHANTAIVIIMTMRCKCTQTFASIFLSLKILPKFLSLFHFHRLQKQTNGTYFQCDLLQSLIFYI